MAYKNQAAGLRREAGNGGIVAGDLATGAVTSAKILDNTVASGDLDTSLLQYAAVSITNAQIKALRASPKTLVAAPGAGKVLQFISAVIFHDYGSNALTETTDNMAVRFTDGSGVIVSQAIEATGFVDQTADTMTNVLPKIDAIAAKTGCENQALVLHNTGDGEYGGNAAADTVWRVKIVYRVHTTGW